MFTAFFESIKYVNHLIPLAFLRIYIGYLWFSLAFETYQTGLFSSQVFIEQYKSQEFIMNYPQWYQNIFESLVYPHWALVSSVIIALQLIVGVSFIIGFLVRPMSLVGLFFCFHMMSQGSHIYLEMYSVLSAVFFTMLIAGAGRCIGFDYYFFKRHRGLWW